MNESLCKKCGEPMQFVGSLLNGRLECPECSESETIAMNLEQARLIEEEEDAGMMLRQPTPDEISRNIKRLNLVNRLRKSMGLPK